MRIPQPKGLVSIAETAFARRLVRNYQYPVRKTAQVPLLVLNAQMRVVGSNRIFCRAFLTSAKRTASPLGPGSWRRPGQLSPVPPVAQATEVCPRTPRKFHDRSHFPAIGPRHHSLNARHLSGSGENSDALLLAIKDVTALVQARGGLDGSHARHRAVDEEQNEMIAHFRSDATLTFANQAFCSFVDRTPEQLIGQSFLEELVAEAERKAIGESLADSASAPGVSVKQVEALASRSPSWSVRPSFDRAGRIAQFQATSRDPDTSGMSGSALLDSQRNVNALTARLISAQEENNKHLARELHGLLGQKLAILGIRLSTVKRKADGCPETLAGLGELTGLVDNLAENVHQVARRLHPAILDQMGLSAALNEEFLSFSRQSGIPSTFRVRNVNRVLPEEISLCLYRVAQETLWNIAKHADAGKVSSVLTGSKAGISLVIQDSGAGFDLEKARLRGRLGLVSMEERVRLLNGDFSVRTEPGAGTRIEVRLPAGPAKS